MVRNNTPSSGNQLPRQSLLRGIFGGWSLRPNPRPQSVTLAALLKKRLYLSQSGSYSRLSTLSKVLSNSPHVGIKSMVCRPILLPL